MIGRDLLVVLSVAVSACGPEVVEATAGSETALGTTGAAGGTTDAAWSSDDGSPPGDTTGANDGGLCSTVVEIDPFVQLHEDGLGRMQVHDFDADGLFDLVGASGMIAFQRVEGFEVVPSPEPIETSACRAGRFDGDDVPDLLCRISGDRLRLYVGGAQESTVDTLVDGVTGLEPGDMDGDGIDDLVVHTDIGARIEAWKGTASGAFELTFSTSQRGLAHGVFAALEPPRIDLVVTDTSDLRVFRGDGTGGFTAADSTAAPSTGLIHVVREGDRDVLLLQWAWSQLETHTGVGIVERDDRGALVGRPYDLSPRLPNGGPAAAQLDPEGPVEIVTGVDDSDGPILEVACSTFRGYEACGTASLDHAPQWLALLPGASDDMRIAYSTLEDGTWIAPITARTCLGPKG